MIEISVERIEKDRKGVHLNCNGSIRGIGDDIRHEMVGALFLLDEVSNGEMLCDALEEFLKEKMNRKSEGGEEDD